MLGGSQLSGLCTSLGLRYIELVDEAGRITRKEEELQGGHFTL